MRFTKEDKLDYIDYLSNEIRKTNQCSETVFTNYYLTNLLEDLKNIKNNLN
jgi:hypothetical protein